MPHYKDTNNQLHFLDDPQFINLLPAGCVEITDVEAEQIGIANMPVLTYAELRANEYPTYAEQFDLLYHGGLGGWKQAIEAIKTKYPKPE